MDSLDEIFADYDRAEFEYIIRDVRAISRNDAEVIKAMESALADPIGYLKKNADRFGERDIDLKDNELADYFEAFDLLYLLMIDELEECDYTVEVDQECELEDFLDALEELKTYDLIADVITGIKGELDADDDVEEWVGQINEKLERKAFIISNDIDTDSYPLTIVDAETYEMLTEGSNVREDGEQSAARNVIGDRDLKTQLADMALGLLVEGEDYGELANTKVEFGYLFYFEDHGIESLFKFETDKTIAYFAAQGDKLMRLNFNEELFRSTTEGFLEMHGDSEE